MSDTGRTEAPPRCGTRHWFSVYGAPGLRSPVCRRCGAPNPRRLNESEQSNYDYAVAQGWARAVGAQGEAQ
jgi:hypothetical protein